MGVYKNNNGTLTPIANETQFIAPVNEYVTKPELEAIVPSDTSADNKLTTAADVDTKINDVWKAQGQLGAKNLLRYIDNAFPYSRNGIDYTLGQDSSIIINGTTTGYSGIDIFDAAKLGAGQFILTTAEILPANCYVQVFDYTTSQVIAFVGHGLRKSIEFTLTPELITHELKLRIAITVEYTDGFDNYKLYPMLRLASDSDDTWQPYAQTNYELMQSDNALAEGMANFGKKLWQGNFTSGSIEVAGAAKYSVFIFNLNGIYALGNAYYGGGCYGVYNSNYKANKVAYRLIATTNGNNIIFTIDEYNKGGMTIDDNNVGTQRQITVIYGLF